MSTVLYRNIADDLRQQIKDGVYNEGDKLPSERHLCEHYEASRITIRQALELLEQEQLVVRRHGKGTFVLPSKYNQLLNDLYSFKDEIEKSGDTPSSKMLDIELVEIDEYLSRKTNLAIGTKVYKLTRLRLSNGQPMMYEDSYIPHEIAPNLDHYNFSKLSLYKTLQDHYDIRIDKAHETLNATLIQKHEAQHLNQKEGSVAMYIQRFAYSNQQLIEYTKSIVVGDKYNYTVELIG